MRRAETSPKKESYLYQLLRGKTYFDPIRFVGYIAEKIGQMFQSGTIFRRKH